MLLLMARIVLDQKTQRNRCVCPYRAWCIQPFLRNAVDDRLKNLVLDLPPVNQRVPWLIGIAVGSDPGLLRVKRPCIASLSRGTHESLAVVGRGVEQVTDDLFPRPPALAPRNRSEERRVGKECRS